ncbi:hypothetical protein GGR58DRAFT_469871 [Xylaria digitata]|nr:hypothetical protein GGR58DRAFT_469871 [Xylaria digitata]
MNRTPLPDMPDHADGPAFTDPDITARLNELDEITSLTESLTQSLRQMVKDEIKSVEGDEVKSVENDLTKRIDTVKTDLIKKIDTDVKSVKDDLTKQIDTIRTDLTKKIDDLEKTFKINITAREVNSMARARNELHNPDEIEPLLSVHTGAQIERFPTTRDQFKQLSHQHRAQILAQLGYPLPHPDYHRTTTQTQDMLAMLVGIKPFSPLFVRLWHAGFFQG